MEKECKKEWECVRKVYCIWIRAEVWYLAIGCNLTQGRIHVIGCMEDFTVSTSRNNEGKARASAAYSWNLKSSCRCNWCRPQTFHLHVGLSASQINIAVLSVSFLSRISRDVSYRAHPQLHLIIDSFLFHSSQSKHSGLAATQHYAWNSNSHAKGNHVSFFTHGHLNIAPVIFCLIFYWSCRSWSRAPWWFLLRVLDPIYTLSEPHT